MTGSKQRSSVFDDPAATADDLDVAGFAPRLRQPAAEDLKTIAAVGREAGFVPRDPPAPPKTSRGDRRYRTGRNNQLNLKVTDNALQLFYELVDRQNMVQGAVFEMAIQDLHAKLIGAKE